MRRRPSITPQERARVAAEALRRKITVALASALLVVGVGAAAAVAVVALVRSAERVDRTERTLDRLDALLLHLDDAETGQRGFIITGDSAYLSPYTRSLSLVAGDTVALRLATADSRVRQEGLDSLFPLVAAKMRELQETVALRATAGFGPTSVVVLSHRGKNLMDAIRSRVVSMERAERELLAVRSARLRTGSTLALSVVIVGSLLALLLAAVIYRALRRDMVEHIRAGRALEIQAEQLREQAAELEHQIDLSQSLAEEAELAAQQAREAAASAEAERDRAEESERRFRETANTAPVLIWTAGTDALVDWFNTPWLEFTGRALEQELGEGWTEGVHPDDLQRCRDVYLESFRAREPYGMHFRLRRYDGEYRWLLLHARPRFAADRTFLGFVGSCFDVTEQRRATDTMAFLGEAGRLAASSLDVDAVLAQLTRHTIPFLADYCSVDLVTESGDIRRVATAHADPEKEDVLREMWARYPFHADDPYGVPAVIRSGEPQFAPELPEGSVAAFARDDEHLAALTRLDPRSYICVPLDARGRTYGALSLVMSDSRRRYTGDDVAVAAELARRAATAIDNARLYAAEHEARRAAEHATEQMTRLQRVTAFLGDASALLASSLDYETTLRRTAELAVPVLSDWCAVDLVDGDGELRRVAAAHPDPAKLALGLELQRRFPTPRETSGTRRVVSTGRSELYPVVTDEMLVAAARGEEHLRMMREIGFTSVMLVPLSARGRVLGVMTFVASASGRHHDEGDLALAEELSRRAAVAVDNARLFADAEEARRRADEARDAAERASRSKSEFLATMSHEIRTPLNAIIGYTQLLELEISGPVTHEQREQLARVSSSGRHLLGLIDDVLDLAKVEAGRLAVSQGRAEAGRAVDVSLALVRPQAAAKRVALIAEGQGMRDLHYHGDEQRVQQILVNLLSNAVKFTEPGGRVSVRCTRADDPPASSPVKAIGDGTWTVFTVEDTGVGISADKIERIFQPFEQGESGYTRAHSGTGLGLTISRRLARLMDGELTVESEPGRGSAFSLWLRSADGVTPERPLPRGVEAPSPAGTGAATPRGLADAALSLRRNVDHVVARFVARLRAERGLPEMTALSDLQLQDHVLTWLTDVTQALVVMESERQEPAELLRDGSAIQHHIGERHGLQRHGLGWDDAALAREFAILAEVLDAELAGGGSAAGDDRNRGAEARQLVRRFVAHTEQASRRALRHAAQTSTRRTTPAGGSAVHDPR